MGYIPHDVELKRIKKILFSSDEKEKVSAKLEDGKMLYHLAVLLQVPDSEMMYLTQNKILPTAFKILPLRLAWRSAIIKLATVIMQYDKSCFKLSIREFEELAKQVL